MTPSTPTVILGRGRLDVCGLAAQIASCRRKLPAAKRSWSDGLAGPGHSGEGQPVNAAHFSATHAPVSRVAAPYGRAP